MALHLVTAPAAAAMTTAIAKTHLKIGSDTTDDSLISALIDAAQTYAETFTGRKFITQTWDYKLDGFPWGSIVLPFTPVSSVSSVAYVDTAGASQTWTASLYQTTLPVGPQATVARIQPAYQQVYPQTRDQWDAVTVRFVCGYGTATTDVPNGILAAMKLLIGHWYANREAVVAGSVSGELALAVPALLMPYVVG